jgi:uncharacterized protein YhhL (DUF1145 family)
MTLSFSPVVLPAVFPLTTGPFYAHLCLVLCVACIFSIANLLQPLAISARRSAALALISIELIAIVQMPILDLTCENQCAEAVSQKYRNKLT